MSDTALIRRILARDPIPAVHEGFFMYDTHGLPLWVQMDYCLSRGCTVALDSFVMDALSAGWSFEKACAPVREALEMNFGPDAQEIMELFVPYVKNKIAKRYLEKTKQT